VKLLLDTCTFMGLAEGDARRSAQVFLSASSAWEISLKHALGKLPLAESPQESISHMRHLHQLESLPVSEDDTVRAGRLPLLHRDPFDRLLVGQAVGQACVLLTPDPLVEQYSVPVLW